MAASSLIGRLVILINGNADNFSKATKKTKTELFSLTKIAGVASGALAAIGVTLSVGVAVNALKNMTLAGINLADELDELSQRTSVSVEKLSLLRNICRYADTDFQTLAKSMGRLALNIDAASTGEGKAAEAFAELGLSAQELKAMSPEQALATISDALIGITDPTHRATLASQIFGKQYQMLMPFLLRGSQGIQELTNRVKRLGGSLSDIDSNTINEARDSLHDLSIIWEGFQLAAAKGFAPVMTAFIGELTESETGVQSLQATFEQFTDSVVSGFAVILNIADQFNIYFQRILMGLERGMQILEYWGTQEQDWAWNDLNQQAAQFEMDQAGPLWGESLIQRMEQNRNRNLPGNQEPKVPGMDEEEEGSEPDTTTDNKPKSFDSMLERLRQEAQSIGQTSLLEQAIADGADEATQQEIRSLEALIADKRLQLELDEEIQRQQEEAEQQARDLIESLKTPQEQLNDQLERNKELLAKGLISEDQFNKANEKAENDIMGSGPKDFGFSASTFGSEAARQSILRFQGIGGKDKAPEETAKNTKSTADSVAKIERKIEKPVVYTIGG